MSERNIPGMEGEKALQPAWKECTHLGEWRVTDSYGAELSIFSKLEETGLPVQNTIYSPKRVGETLRENTIVGNRR